MSDVDKAVLSVLFAVLLAVLLASLLVPAGLDQKHVDCATNMAQNSSPQILAMGLPCVCRGMRFAACYGVVHILPWCSWSGVVKDLPLTPKAIFVEDHLCS